MKALLSDLWSLVLPATLSLCAVLTLLSMLADTFVRRRRRKTQQTRATKATTAAEPAFALSFALPFAPVLLLLALWLSPQTVATTATLLARQSPDALHLLFLASPLALLFLWCEGSVVAKATERTKAKEEEGQPKNPPSTVVERLAVRVFANPPFATPAYRAARATAMLFAFCCLLSILCDLLPTLAQLFFRQAAQASLQANLHAASPTSGNGIVDSGIVDSGIVSMVGLGLLLGLALPQFLPKPNTFLAWLLLLLLPCALLFYAALCLIATQQADTLGVANDTLPLRATTSSFNADTLLATFGVFRPAFGWLALLCCLPLVVKTNPLSAKRRTLRVSATLLFLCLAFACLLGFVAITAAPVAATKTWLLGEQGLKPLQAAFLSLYPNEGWLLSASLAALAATTLLALCALTRAALSVFHEKATLFTPLLILPAAQLAVLASGDKGWQTSLLFTLQRAQELGQLAQGIATLLFLVALCLLAVRSLLTMVKLLARQPDDKGAARQEP